MHRHNPPAEPVKTHIAPADLFHNSFERGCIRESGQRIGQIVVFLKSFSDNGAKQGSESVKVEMKQ